MDYGIAIPSYVDAWKEVKAAEEAGFTHAWFFDSQLIYSDVWATMALAAHNTEKIKLGTLVAIPSNRIVSVTAAAAATINKIAPGRVIVGLGTGYTGRNTMGLPALKMDDFANYARQLKGLLVGDDVLINEGSRERWIRLIHTKKNSGREEFFNIEDPIPVMLAANGPKGHKIVGEVSDGWITTSRSSNVPQGLPRIAKSAEASGNSFDRFGGDSWKPYVTVLTSSCLLRPGETFTSPRVIESIGPALVPGVHAMWESSFGPGSNLGMSNSDIANSYNEYINQYSENKSQNLNQDRRYLDVHEGHYVYLKEGEEQFVSGDLIARTLSGKPQQVNEKLDKLESIGVDNVALSVVGKKSALDLIKDFGRLIIQERG